MAALRTLADRITEASRTADSPIIRAADVARLRRSPEGSLEHVATVARVLRRLHDAGIVGVMATPSASHVRARRSHSSPL
jgi:hypothetical protein